MEGSAEGPKKKTDHVKRQGLQKNLQMNESKQKRPNKQVEALISMGPETYLGKEGTLGDINSRSRSKIAGKTDKGLY